MKILDSSAWLEYIVDSPNADLFELAIKDTNSLIIPTIVIYEVYKFVKRERSLVEAISSRAIMEKGHIVELTANLASLAADLSVKHKLAMADSIIYATAVTFKAELWTQDVDFKNLANVKYFPK